MWFNLVPAGSSDLLLCLLLSCMPHRRPSKLVREGCSALESRLRESPNMKQTAGAEVAAESCQLPRTRTPTPTSPSQRTGTSCWATTSFDRLISGTSTSFEVTRFGDICSQSDCQIDGLRVHCGTFQKGLEGSNSQQELALNNVRCPRKCQLTGQLGNGSKSQVGNCRESPDVRSSNRSQRSPREAKTRNRIAV